MKQMEEIDDARDAVWRDWLVAIRRSGGGSAIVLLVIIGGVLRFVRLSHPPLLYDEAATYTRVTGSLRDLFMTLRDDGFPPLHYEIYWLMSRFIRLTPFMMRLIPALAGTAMIPAIYFLARQVTSKKVATIAAALTAFSAYQLVYSRDAKMYMELWLCATLFIGCLLWWLRSRRCVAWMAWVASACAMNGLQALGLCVAIVAIVIILIYPRFTARRLFIALCGLAISCSALLTYRLGFNRWQNNINESGWHTSGLEWIGQRNERMSKPMLVWDVAASWMLAYRSPRPPVTPPNRVIHPIAIVSAIIGILLVLGMWRWPPHLRDDDPQDVPADAAGGRGMLWMAIWLLLPFIGFFVVSFVMRGHDVWNARYLAIVWPAGVILVAWLIQRLPAPWLRAGAIGLLVAANLIQFGLRITTESGVPVDQIARDVANADASKGAEMTIVTAPNRPDATSLGGNGGIYDLPGRYYLAIDTGLHLHPKALRDQPFKRHFHLNSSIDSVPATVQKLIVWSDGPAVDEQNDPTLQSLGAAWERASCKEHPVIDFWCWRRMFRCHRSVYERADMMSNMEAAPVKRKKRK